MKFLGLLIPFIFFSHLLFANETLVLKADEWCPFNCKPNAQPPGFLVEIAQTVLLPKGYKVQYEVMPWNRALDEAKQGKIAGVFGADVNDAPELIYPSVPAGRSRNCFFALANSSFKYSNPKDLEKFLLGVAVGYTYHPDVDVYIAANKSNSKRIDVAAGENPNQTNLRKLTGKRIDVMLDNESVINWEIKKDSLKNIESKYCFESITANIAFSPKHPKAKELAKIVADGVTSMRKSGELKKILDKYNIKDWE